MSDFPEAANGLLNRRWFLKAGVAASGATLLAPAMADGPWMTYPGEPPGPYGAPSRFTQLKREQITQNPLGPAEGASCTPLQSLNGIITPNSLHFERHHSGIPDIDPEQHKLTVFGNVKKPLTFTSDSLKRYPLQTKTWFLECSGNSYRNTIGEAPDMTAGEMSGLLSCAEWTGVPLHYLLDEAGADSESGWIIAEGADASGNNRSIPMAIAQHAIIALYQNGEPIRPAQGFPMRLFVPGCEGNISIKWLRSLKLTNQPAHTREETSKYTDLMHDGTARQFSLRMEVKSLITSPSGKMQLPTRGIYPITGLAWSGHAAIRKVEVSADGGKSWAESELQTEPAPLRPVRFRIPWHWQGQPAILQSRATDQAGNVQPTREVALRDQSQLVIYHFNGIQSWQVNEAGRVRNVHG